MRQPIRIGLAGCGRLAEAGYVPASRFAGGLEIVAVCDPEPGRRDAVGAALALGDADRYASMAALIDGTAPDAVVIASPASTHVGLAREAAAAGLPALVEKPPAPDAAGARELARLDPAPWVAFNRRFSLGRGLDSPRALSPARVEATIHYRRASWRPYGDLGDAWLDLGPHLVDLALLAGADSGGSGLEVVAAGLRPERAEVTLRGDGCEVVLSAATARPHREQLRVEASDGSALFARRDGGLRELIPRPWRPHPLVASLAAGLEAFGAIARGERRDGPAPATAAEGLRVMELIDAARAAAGAERAPA